MHVLFFFLTVCVESLINPYVYGSDKALPADRPLNKGDLPSSSQQTNPTSPTSRQNAPLSRSSRTPFSLSSQRASHQNTPEKQGTLATSSPDPSAKQKQPSEKSLEWHSKSYLPSLERVDAPKTLQNALENDTTGMNKRRYEASKGRAKQVLGTEITHVTSEVANVLGSPAQGMARSSDPSVKMVGVVASSLASALKGSGLLIGTILGGLGRYQERMQKIFSVNEQLVDAAQQHFEKMEILAEEMDERVTFRTLPEAVKASQGGKEISTKKRIKRTLNPLTWKNSIEKLLDKTYLTDFKTKRGEEIAHLQKKLKEEQIVFEDMIRLLQVKFLEEALKDIDKLLNKERTLQIIESNLHVLQEAQKSLVKEIGKTSTHHRTKEKEKLLTVLSEHEDKIRTEEGEKNYYSKVALNEEARKDLGGKKQTLREEITRLYHLTRLYKERMAAPEDELKADFTVIEKEKLLHDIEEMKTQLRVLQEKLKSP